MTEHTRNAQHSRRTCPSEHLVTASPLLPSVSRNVDKPWERVGLLRDDLMKQARLWRDNRA